MDISSRHLPDLSDTSVMRGASDASFQIPVGSSSRTLLADESLGFLDAVDVTLTSPQKTPRRTTRSSKAPMTFFELTPRSRPRVACSRSPKKRPAIPSPLKQAVTNDMNAALGDTLSPFKPPELSFQIPAIGKSSMDLLMDDTSGEFFGKGTTASFMEEPLSPRAREPLTLSQLTPGPKIVRSPSPTKAAIGSSEDAIDENADPAQGEDDRFLDGSPAGHTRLPSLFSNLKAEIETLVRDEHTSGEDASCSSPLAFNAQPVVPSIEGDTKNATDTVEVRSLAPSIQSAEVMPSVTNGLVTGAVSGHDSIEQTKSDVNAQEIVRYTKPTSSEPSRSTVNGMLSGKKSDSQSQLTGRTSTQTVRNYASNSEANPTQSENIDASNVSCDATVSEADGFASALASHGQTAAAVPTIASTRPLRLTNTKVKLDRDVPKAGALSAVLNPVTVKRAISPRGAQPEATNAQLRAADANEQATFVEHNDQPPVPYHASPHEDEDVEMTDAPGLASNSDNQLKSPGESQTGHDASGKTPGSSAEIAAPPSPMRASSKRSASAVSDDHAPQEAPQRKRAKVTPTVAEPPVPSQRKARRVKGASRISKAATSTRILRSTRRKPAAVPPTHPGKSSGESGFAPPRSAARRTPDDELSTPRPAPSSSRNDLTTSTGDARSGDPGHAHMTRAKARALTHASVSSASSSTTSRSGDSHPGNPSDTEAGRQVPPFAGIRATNAQGGRHMHRSHLNEPSATLPPAKPTKPIEFHFESEARIEARRAGFPDSGYGSSLKQSQDEEHPSIPEYQILQDREREARRQQIVPVHSQGFHFSTDARVEDRRKYDEARREREREAERLLEEQRRLEALEEEKEIKELRRRMVPKAHEVPEWYAFAPKRSQARP